MLKSKLITINQIFQHSKTFEEAFERSQVEFQALFAAEQIRLYKRDPKKSELFAQVHSNEKHYEIRLAFSTSSVAGYTALSQLPLLLKSVTPDNLKAVHVDLTYDSEYDNAVGFQTRDLISMPIQCESSLMGVLQVLNKKRGCFSREDEAFCRLIVNIMGQKLHTERNLPAGPYENLVFRGLLSRKQLQDVESIFTKTGIAISRILRSEYNISPDDIGASLELYYQIPFVRYENNSISGQKLKGINRQYLINNLWLPLQISGENAVVLVHDPHDGEMIEDIRRILNVKSYEFRVGLPEEILAFLGDISQLPLDMQEKSLQSKPSSADGSGDGLASGLDNLGDAADFHDALDENVEISRIEEEDISQENSQLAVSFVNKIIVHAHNSGASDIHIEPSRPGRPGVVRMRIDGSCERVLSVPADIMNTVISRIKIISNLNISERRLPQDGKARVRFKGRELELRVATLPTVHGESVVLRMLSSGQSLPFEKLNLSTRNKEQIELLMNKPHGIFLVVGPTGSGKTTTLHSILSQINTPDKKIWTVEDPVEITQAGLQQVQVENIIGLDFTRVMRSFLRADPDVILVGEMRDMQTAQIGIEASLTGHMVFSTLHTNSAPETLTRLLDMGVEAINFSEALQGVLAQRLVKTLCSHCREGHQPTDEEWEYLVDQYGADLFPELGIERSGSLIYNATGCDRCSQTGYKGRTGIHELLVATPEVKKAIVRKQPADDIAKIARDQGMRSLHQDGICKIFKGDIDIFQLQKVTSAS